MSVTRTLPGAILETILNRLALLFLVGADGDLAAARHAAAQMLDAYHPRTEHELRLAANIVSFGFHVLEALSQASTPDMKLTSILRLRGSAVSLNRESDKAERRLDLLQKARREGTPAEPLPASAQSVVEAAIDLSDDPPTAPASSSADACSSASALPDARANGQTWTRAYEQQQCDQRIAASLQRAEARVASHAHVTTATHRHPAMGQTV